MVKDVGGVSRECRTAGENPATIDGASAETAGVLEFVRDVSAADWVGGRLAPWQEWTLGMVVPRGYEAYARILHPPSRPDGTPTTWGAVCRTTGYEAHPLMQWETAGEGWPGTEPYVGSLESEPLALLGEVLAGHTRGWCYFALWEGFGWIPGSRGISFSDGHRVPPAFAPDVLSGPRLRLPHRDYLLFRGQLADLLHLGWTYPGGTEDLQSPNLMWPADRSWFVSTEIDFDSTLVGGSEELVDEVVSASGLEAWRVDVADSLDRVHLHEV
jgi:hypothetical protein